MSSQPKITFADTRASGVPNVLMYCSDYRLRDGAQEKREEVSDAEVRSIARIAVRGCVPIPTPQLKTRQFVAFRTDGTEPTVQTYRSFIS